MRFPRQRVTVKPSRGVQIFQLMGSEQAITKTESVSFVDVKKKKMKKCFYPGPQLANTVESRFLVPLDKSNQKSFLSLSRTLQFYPRLPNQFSLVLDVREMGILVYVEFYVWTGTQLFTLFHIGSPERPDGAGFG